MPEESHPLVQLAGSERSPLAGAAPAGGELDGYERAELTLVLRRRAELPDAMDSELADAAALGITVCIASGDNGSDDAVGDGQQHVDFPASSPHALGCGGTKLLADPATGVISSEVVWNETAANEGAGGGGVSDQYGLPSWQADAGVPPRPAARRAGPAGAGCRTWRATPTRPPATRSTPAARLRSWAAPARSPRCGRR